MDDSLKLTGLRSEPPGIPCFNPRKGEEISFFSKRILRLTQLFIQRLRGPFLQGLKRPECVPAIPSFPHMPSCCVQGRIYI
jgi:hypothetical protein